MSKYINEIFNLYLSEREETILDCPENSPISDVQNL